MKMYIIFGLTPPPVMVKDHKMTIFLGPFPKLIPLVLRIPKRYTTKSKGNTFFGETLYLIHLIQI